MDFIAVILTAYWPFSFSPCFIAATLLAILQSVRYQPFLCAMLISCFASWTAMFFINRKMHCKQLFVRTYYFKFRFSNVEASTAVVVIDVIRRIFLGFNFPSIPGSRLRSPAIPGWTFILSWQSNGPIETTRTMIEDNLASDDRRTCAKRFYHVEKKFPSSQN